MLLLPCVYGTLCCHTLASDLYNYTNYTIIRNLNHYDYNFKEIGPTVTSVLYKLHESYLVEYGIKTLITRCIL